MTIRRGNVATKYTKVSNSVAQDMSISPEAKGVWLFLVSQRADWAVFPKWLAKEMGIGRDKMYKILNELIDHKLCRREQRRKRLDSGREVAGAMEYVIYGEPDEWEDVQLPDFQDAECQEAGRHDTTKEYIEKERNIEQQLLPSPPKGEQKVNTAPSKKLVVVPPLCLSLGADQDSFVRLLALYSEEAIVKACDVAVSQGTRPDNFFGWIRDCIDKGYQVKASKEAVSNDNRKILHDMFGHLDGKRLGPIQVCIGLDYIEFISSGVCAPHQIKTSESDFESKVRSYIRMLQERLRRP